MFQFELINIPTTFTINEKDIEQILSLVLREVPKAQHGKINIAFVTDEVMREYNNNYRGKDSTTDVLSFHYFDDFSTISSNEVAGEVLFSESKILSQAKEHTHTPGHEFQILLVHSILHLLGFDHETDDEYIQMWKYESILRKEIS